MGVQRLWWIPDGVRATDGVYVRYPREELLAVIAAEAARTSTTIVGENLGTVPEEVTEALERWDVVGLYEEQFNLYHRSALPPVPARLRRRHPHPRHAGVRRRLQRRRHRRRVRLPPARRRRRRSSRSATARRPCSTPPSSGSPRSDAYLVVADLDDLVGETAPHNVPGQGPAVDVAAPAAPRRRRTCSPTPTSAAASSILGTRPAKMRATMTSPTRSARSTSTCSTRAPTATCTTASAPIPTPPARGSPCGRRTPRPSTCSATSTAGRASRWSRSGGPGIWSATSPGRSSGSPTATPSPATTASGSRSPTPSGRRRTSRRRRRR